MKSIRTSRVHSRNGIRRGKIKTKMGRSWNCRWSRI